MGLLPIGTKVTIKTSAKGSYNSPYSPTSTIRIIDYSNDPDFPYKVDKSSQCWNESAFCIIEQAQSLENLKVFESMYIEHFGRVLRLPTGYVFSSQFTFVPSTINTL